MNRNLFLLNDQLTTLAALVIVIRQRPYIWYWIAFLVSYGFADLVIGSMRKNLYAIHPACYKYDRIFSVLKVALILSNWINLLELIHYVFPDKYI